MLGSLRRLQPAALLLPSSSSRRPSTFLGPAAALPLTPKALFHFRKSNARARDRQTHLNSLSRAVARPDERKQPSGPFAGLNRRTVPHSLKELAAARTAPARPRFERGPRPASRPGSRAADADATAAAAAGPGGPHSRSGAPAQDYRRHASGQKRSKQDRPGAYKALKMQAALSTVSYTRRAQIKDAIADQDSFRCFDLLDVVQDAIQTDVLARHAGDADGGPADLRPTPIQRLAIPALLSASRAAELADDPSSPAPSSSSPTAPAEFLLAAETGSGKTLAYLAPLVDAVKRLDEADKRAFAAWERAEAQKRADSAGTYVTPPLVGASVDPAVACRLHPAGRPRAVVLVPTAELVEQVGRVAKQMAHGVKLRVAPVSARHSATVIRNRLFGKPGLEGAPGGGGGADIVIATPHLLASIVDDGHAGLLDRVRHVVLDEADSLLDKSFSATVLGLCDRMRGASLMQQQDHFGGSSTDSPAPPAPAAPAKREPWVDPPARLHTLTLATATIPKSLDGKLAAEFPALVRLTSPGIHMIPRRVRMDVVDVCKAYRGSKDAACADVIWQAARAASAAGGAKKFLIVFVNERERTVELARFLRTKGIDAVSYCRDSTVADPAGQDAAAAEPKSNFRARRGSPTAARDRAGMADVLADFVTLPSAAAAAAAAEPPSAAGSSGPESAVRADPLSTVRVLVTTDISSRGLDTVAVSHVILYDVPRSTVDYVHRVGRVGRVGSASSRNGRATVLMNTSRGDRADVAREVREGMFTGKALI